MIDRLERALGSEEMRAFALAVTRISMAGLLFWWGLAKGLDIGVGQAVSENFYGGLFSARALLIGFGWVQVAAAVALMLGLWRRVLLPLQLVVNGFVAAAVWVYFIDPFWLWMGGGKPLWYGHLFYPSLIVASVSLLLITLRDQDRWALDRLIAPDGRRIAA